MRITRIVAPLVILLGLALAPHERRDVRTSR